MSNRKLSKSFLQRRNARRRALRSVKSSKLDHGRKNLEMVKQLGKQRQLTVRLERLEQLQNTVNTAACSSSPTLSQPSLVSMSADVSGSSSSDDDADGRLSIKLRSVMSELKATLEKLTGTLDVETITDLQRLDHLLVKKIAQSLRLYIIPDVSEMYAEADENSVWSDDLDPDNLLDLSVKSEPDMTEYHTDAGGVKAELSCARVKIKEEPVEPEENFGAMPPSSTAAPGYGRSFETSADDLSSSRQFPDKTLPQEKPQSVPSTAQPPTSPKQPPMNSNLTGGTNVPNLSIIQSRSSGLQSLLKTCSSAYTTNLMDNNNPPDPDSGNEGRLVKNVRTKIIVNSQKDKPILKVYATHSSFKEQSENSTIGSHNGINTATTAAEHIDHMYHKTSRSNEEGANKFKSGPVHPYSCNLCEVICISLAELMSHVILHFKKKFECKNCDYSTDALDDLLEHFRTHIGELNHCVFCKFTTKGQRPMLMHMKKHNIKERVTKFSCATCGRDFCTRNALTIHLRSHDPNYRPLKKLIQLRKDKLKHESDQCSFITDDVLTTPTQAASIEPDDPVRDAVFEGTTEQPVNQAQTLHKNIKLEDSRFGSSPDLPLRNEANRSLSSLGAAPGSRREESYTWWEEPDSRGQEPDCPGEEPDLESDEEFQLEIDIKSEPEELESQYQLIDIHTIKTEPNPT